MKKISILALHLGYGGIEKCIVSLANLLVPYYEVEILCVYKLYDKPSFTLDERVTVHYLLNNRKPNAKAFREALSKKRILRTLKEGLKALKTLYLRKKEMVKAIKKSDADIIIATRDIFDEWLSLYGQEGVFKIGWEHNHHHQNKKYARDIVRSSKNLDVLVLVSRDLASFYEKEMQAYPCSCIYIPNMIEKVPRKNARLEEKHLISVGRLSPEKGYSDLIELSSSLFQKYPDWHLDIIGDGDEKAQLEAKIKENRLDSFITLHGFQNSDTIYEFLQHASIYLMTSHTESFGIVLLEAMSHGVPCIAYDSAEGAREIIQSGYNGYLIKHRNKEAYLQKVADLIENKEVRSQLGKHAKQSIAPYTKERVLHAWLTLLEKGR